MKLVLEYVEEKKAHQHSTNNKKELNKSSICGCFYCCEIYTPSEIKDYLNEGEGTALCPYCGVDSVIADTSEYKITKDFLMKMHNYWFK